MKILLFLFMTGIISILPLNNLSAITVGDYADPSYYSCYYTRYSYCWISNNAYYEDYAPLTISAPLPPVQIQAIEGCETTTYFYIPDPDQYTGKGVINGYMQYFPNNPDAIVRTYTDSNSSIYTNYADWAAALQNMSIIPPNPY
jgi:hypothetical protein